MKALDNGQAKNKKTILAGAISLGFVILIFLGLYSGGFYVAKILVINYGYQSSVGQISPLAKVFAEGKVAVSKLYELMERKKSLT